MNEPKFLLYPAEDDIDEDDSLTEREMAEMLVKSTTGYNLTALVECVKALELLSKTVDAGQSADYAALQEHRSMRFVRAALEKLNG